MPTLAVPGICVRPPAASVHSVAESPLIAFWVTSAKVESARAAPTVLSEVPPTITTKGLARLVLALVKPLPNVAPEPPSPLALNTVMLRSAASVHSSAVAL